MHRFEAYDYYNYRMRVALVVTVLVVVAVPAPAHAWGFAAHKFIMDRAIALLPAELRPMFEANRAMVVERAIDPDTWRTAGFDQGTTPPISSYRWGVREVPFAACRAATRSGREVRGRPRYANGKLPWD